MTDLSRTSLTPYARFMQEPDENGAKKMAARQWHQTGAVVILPDSIARMTWEDRDFLNAIAARLYGPRENGVSRDD